MRQDDGTRPRKTKTEKAGKLLGLSPDGDSAKLKTNKSVLVIGENFGAALDPQPQNSSSVILPARKALSLPVY